MEPQKPTLESFGAPMGVGLVSFCCGCICVSYCFRNTTAAMDRLIRLVTESKLEVPHELAKLIEIEVQIGQVAQETKK